MPDVAIAVATPSPLASLLAGTPADTAATSATAQPADPFAALLANATNGKTDAAKILLSANPATARAAKPAALPLIITVADPATTPAPIAADALPAIAAVLPATKDDGEDDNKAAAQDENGDPLADAIASGATAVLALAPAIVPPVVAPPVETATPIVVDAPVKRSIGKIASGAASQYPHLRFKSDAAATASNMAKDSATTIANGKNDQASAQPQAARVPVPISGTPAAAPLPPAVIQAAVAALQQGDDATAQPDTTDTTDTKAVMAAAAAAKAQGQQPAVQTVQQQIAPVASNVRRRSDDVAAPRRATDARRRTDTIAPDATPVSLAERVSTNASTKSLTSPVQDKGDAVVQQTLSIAKDSAWLDTLARDIANSAGSGNDLKFKLEPQNLGSLTVAISQSDDGASIRMTADNHTTRDILLDAQPKLMAEARAQGMKISDSQVDVSKDQTQNQSANQDSSRWAQNNSGQNGAAQNGQNRQSSPGHQPFVSNLGRKADAESESSDGDSDALYA